MLNNKKLILGGILCITMVSAFAAPAGTGIFDTIINSIYTPASTWFTKEQGIAAGVFFLVSTIEFTYAIAFKKMLAGDHQKLFYTMITRIIVMSLLFQFFVKDMSFYFGILKWGINIGSLLGGDVPQGVDQGAIYSVSGLFNLMWSGVKPVIGSLVGISIATAAIMTSVSLFMFGLIGAIIIVILTCCVTVMWLLGRSWIIMFGGFFLSGFIGSHWTRNYWQNYLKSIIGVALSLLALSLVLAIISKQWSDLSWLPELPDWKTAALDPGGFISTAINRLVGMLGAVIFDAVLIIGGPGLGASLASGAIGTGLGEAIGAAAGVLAGATMVGKGAQAAGTVANAAAGAGAAGKQAAQASMRASLKNGIGGGEGNSSDDKFREMARSQAKQAGSKASAAHLKGGVDSAKKQLTGAGQRAGSMGNNFSRATGGSGGGGPASINTNAPSHH